MYKAKFIHSLILNRIDELAKPDINLAVGPPTKSDLNSCESVIHIQLNERNFYEFLFMRNKPEINVLKIRLKENMLLTAAFILNVFFLHYFLFYFLSVKSLRV